MTRPPRRHACYYFELFSISSLFCFFVSGHLRAVPGARLDAFAETKEETKKIMNGDGDILGTRRRPETVQSSEALMKAVALPGGSILQQQSQADAAALRHAPGASPMKRTRSMGGGASGIRGGETEVRITKHRYLHGDVCGGSFLVVPSLAICFGVLVGALLACCVCCSKFYLINILLYSCILSAGAIFHFTSRDAGEIQGLCLCLFSYRGVLGSSG